MNAVFVLAILAAGEGQTLRQGGIEATATVHVPDEGVGPALARLRVDVQVRGPVGLHVTQPRLEDAFAAWRMRGRASSWRETEAGTIIDLSLMIDQVKPGVVNPPGVALRASVAVVWEEFAWPDLLHEAHDVAPIEKTPTLAPSPWPARLGMFALAIACSLALTFLVRAVIRRSPAPIPADVRALALLEGSPISAGERIGHCEVVVRDFLDERYGLNTRRQTAREMLAACASLPQEARSALAELMHLAELAKYAGIAVEEDSSRCAQELARRVIVACQTLPVGKEASIGEKEKNGGER